MRFAELERWGRNYRVRHVGTADVLPTMVIPTIDLTGYDPEPAEGEFFVPSVGFQTVPAYPEDLHRQEFNRDDLFPLLPAQELLDIEAYADALPLSPGDSQDAAIKQLRRLTLLRNGPFDATSTVYQYTFNALRTKGLISQATFDQYRFGLPTFVG